MTEARRTSYIVSAYDTLEKVWKTVLATGDKAEAEAMKVAMEQDGVLARIEIMKPRKR